MKCVLTFIRVDCLCIALRDHVLDTLSSIVCFGFAIIPVLLACIEGIARCGHNHKVSL